MTLKVKTGSNSMAIIRRCLRSMALDGCPLLQCILVVVQGLCHAWMPCKYNSGFRQMKRGDGFDAPGDVGTHAGPELVAVCGMGHKRYP